jgi:hypothetical protein
MRTVELAIILLLAIVIALNSTSAPVASDKITMEVWNETQVAQNLR